MKKKSTPRERKTRKQRLTQTAKKPMLALEKGWYKDPRFCQGLCDLCDDLAFVMSPETLQLAHRVVHVAERNGDPHLINRSYGVLSHAYIISRDPYWAGKVLEGARRGALECCPRCRSQHLWREGDLLGEQRQVRESLAALNGALEEGGDMLSADTRARILLIRAISHFFDGQRARSIADAGATFADLSLTSPRGYLVDGVACLPTFAGAGGGPDDDRAALGHIDHVLERVRGLDGWVDLRRRSALAKAQFHANLGDVRRARDLLTSAIGRLFLDGLARELVGAILDLGMLRCRHPEPREDGLALTRQLIERCLARRVDLPEPLREGLNEMLNVLAVYPEGAFDRLLDFRRSFITPVPGILGERLALR